jgi:hypothetical protein
MLNFSASTIRYEPYPLAVLRPAMDPALYGELCRSFPDAALFGTIPKYDYKLSLSEKFNSATYERFLAENRSWGRFHAWIKSEDFIRQTVQFLSSNNIDLDLTDYLGPASQKLSNSLSRILGPKRPSRSARLRSRFEFSVLKADGGEVAPHTDTPKKIVTLVLSMIRDGEWDPKFGGGLDVNRATDNAYAFNWKNRIVPWEKIEVIDTVSFVPNQCIVFVKTFNSLHSVRRMTEKGSNALRKTVTIVIERDE